MSPRDRKACHSSVTTALLQSVIAEIGTQMSRAVTLDYKINNMSLDRENGRGRKGKECPELLTLFLLSLRHKM
jgi:hypothetical protein